MNEDKIFKIFPSIQVRYSASGYFIEIYQPKNYEYAPIKFYDKSNLNIQHIIELKCLIEHIDKVSKK